MSFVKDNWPYLLWAFWSKPRVFGVQCATYEFSRVHLCYRNEIWRDLVNLLGFVYKFSELRYLLFIFYDRWWLHTMEINRNWICLHIQQILINSNLCLYNKIYLVSNLIGILLLYCLKTINVNRKTMKTMESLKFFL